MAVLVLEPDVVVVDAITLLAADVILLDEDIVLLLPLLTPAAAGGM